MKTTCPRARWLEIAVSYYHPARSSRTTYCAKEDSWSRVRGVESSYQVFGKGAASSHQPYYV